MADDIDVNSDEVSKGLMEALLDPRSPARGREKAPVPIQEPKPVGIGAKASVPEQARPQPSQPTTQEEEEPTSDELSPEDLALLEEPSSQEDEELEFDIPVDGEIKKVTLKELKSTYSGEGAIEKRLQQATETKKEVQQQLVSLYDANKATLDKLQMLDEALAPYAEPNINWELLRQQNPEQYLLAREEQRQFQERRALVQRDATEAQTKQEQLHSQAMEMYLNDQALQLADKLPELADPNKSPVLMDRIKKAVKHFGYEEQELKDVTDHRVFVVLDYASKYLDLLNRKAGLKTTNAEPSATLKTAASKPASNTSKKREETILNKARKSGHPDDVAQTLFMPPRRSTRG
jgi:hypothetical protein